MGEGSFPLAPDPGMSRRNTYLLGGVAAVAGIAMLVFAIAALTSGDDESTSPNRGAGRQTATQTPSPPSGAIGGGAKNAPSAPSGTNVRGEAIHRDLARRRPVRAPDFSAEILQDGSIPQVLKGPFDRAANGGKLVMSKLRGTPVVLYFFSSRCAPCRADTRLVETTWTRWGPRGVLFVGVSVKDAPGSAEALLRQYDVTYPAVLDRSGEIATRYGTITLPQTFFVSSSGDIVGEVAGSPSVRQLEVGTAAAKSGETFGSEQGGSRIPIQ
jgi:peroxiredoxin